LLVQLRARSALAAAAVASDRKQLLETAERDSRRLERENAHWSKPHADLIRAAVIASRGDKEAALSLLQESAHGFDSVDMALYAAAARYRQGQLLGGTEGSELIDAARSWMANQKIQNPA